MIAEQTAISESVLKCLECLDLVSVDVAREVLLGEVDVDWLAGIRGLIDLVSGAGDVDAGAGAGAQATVEEGDDGVALVDGLFVDDLLRGPTESRDGVIFEAPAQQAEPCRRPRITF